MNENKIAIYQSDASAQLEVLLQNETIWLTQAQMVMLFERDQSVISKHIRNIFKEGELDKNSVYAKFAYTATDGKTYEVEHYSLDVIISVGYRVKSQKGTQFRIWANKILKEYLMKGYAVNEKILKEKNAELITQLQALSMLIINEIPLTKEMAVDMMMKTIKNE